MAKDEEMKLKKKYVLSDSQLGLLFKEQQFQQVLTTGTHEFWDWKNQLTMQSINVTNTLNDGVTKDVLYLADLYPAAFADYLHQWETGENEIGLV
jgi:hypothetical protein